MSCSYFFEVQGCPVVTSQKGKLNTDFGITVLLTLQGATKTVCVSTFVLWELPLSSPQDFEGSDKAFLPQSKQYYIPYPRWSAYQPLTVEILENIIKPSALEPKQVHLLWDSTTSPRSLSLQYPPFCPHFQYCISHISFPFPYFLTAQWDLQGAVLNRPRVRQEIGYCPTFRPQSFELWSGWPWQWDTLSSLWAQKVLESGSALSKTSRDICTAGSEAFLRDHEARVGFLSDKGCTWQSAIFLRHLSWCIPSLHTPPLHSSRWLWCWWFLMEAPSSPRWHCSAEASSFWMYSLSIHNKLVSLSESTMIILGQVSITESKLMQQNQKYHLFLFHMFWHSCQNLVPTLPTIQLEIQVYNTISG